MRSYTAPLLVWLALKQWIVLFWWSHPMRVLVLGAGVIGTTTAWYLAQAGYQLKADEVAPYEYEGQ